jgi:hypothetical protein
MNVISCPLNQYITFIISFLVLGFWWNRSRSRKLRNRSRKTHGNFDGTGAARSIVKFMELEQQEALSF